MSYERLEVAVHKNFGLLGSKTLRFLIHCVAIFTPLSLVGKIPISISSICSSYLLSMSHKTNRFEIWLKNLENTPAFRKVFLHRRLHSLFRNADEAEFLLLLEDMQKSPDQKVFVSEWVYFNLNQDQLIDYLTKQKRVLVKANKGGADSKTRYLPDHTKHMGHLGFLFLYCHYYGVQDPARKVAVWPHLSPNSFYLKKLVENSPLSIKLMSKDSWGVQVDDAQIDTITMSKAADFVWRFEPLIAAGTAQEFPEFNIAEVSLLMPDIATHEISEKKLVSIGFDPNRWFVILHVKEDKLGYAVSGETRDASIMDYLATCRIVRDLGGQVVRMGSQSFPKLPQDFPAVDYAHSHIRTDFIDYWLWANCLYWIGNCNGASVAVLPFGKPRLVTNQWPVDPNGPSRDFVLPKLAYSEKLSRYLTFGETVKYKYGRTMNKAILQMNGIKIANNSPDLIVQSFLELFGQKNAKLLNSKSSEIESELYSATRTPLNTPRMSLSESFKDSYRNKLIG